MFDKIFELANAFVYRGHEVDGRMKRKLENIGKSQLDISGTDAPVARSTSFVISPSHLYSPTKVTDSKALFTRRQMPM